MMLAYLVIREGAKWTDVFRLVPGQTVTIGRAPTNQIVVKDERCSRNHAEVFAVGSRWTLRDLGSRNGTVVGGHPVRGDYVLDPGDVIRIANCQLAFVHDLAKAFSESVLDTREPDPSEETAVTRDLGMPQESPSAEELGDPAMITHRRGQTRFLAAHETDSTTPKVGKAATRLCRLAFELAKLQDVVAVANLALNGLFESTKVDAGAVLLAPRELHRPPQEGDLAVVAARADREPRYHRLSSFLAMTVLREGEAVLARNVSDDSTLGSRDSKGEIHSTSVICAPIRQGNRIAGLFHLYSSIEERQPDPDDLEFTLAVADNVALALANLGRQQELAENLSQSKVELLQLRQQLAAESEIVGSSAAVARVQQQIEQAARSRATVLISGESGAGKELVARAVHFSGPRKKGPYVCLNCAALSESLLESELFGHERGAFTGATDRKIGKFEAANHGTLLLDEIGEMSPSIQAKFLRVLEGHPFERLGGSQAVKVDVRVIAATNRDLERAVSEARFRQDLFFRLRVLEIRVPPLRERPEDIIELASYFVERFNGETGRRIRGFTPEAFELLRRYRWPGNVRELKNVIERAVVLAAGDYIDTDDLVLSNLQPVDEPATWPPPRGTVELISLADVERRHVLATLNATNWNKSRTANILGIERSTLDRKLRRYGLKPGDTPNSLPLLDKLGGVSAPSPRATQ